MLRLNARRRRTKAEILAAKTDLAEKEQHYLALVAENERVKEQNFNLQRQVNEMGSHQNEASFAQSDVQPGEPGFKFNI